MKVFTRIIVAAALATSLLAQPPAKSADQEKKEGDKQEQKFSDNFYKLSFALYELQDGKRVNQRDYMVVGKTEDHHAPSIRISTRIPIYTEETNSDKKITYIDAGLILNCTLYQQPSGKVLAQCEINLSGFVRPDQLPDAHNNSVAAAPVLRSTISNTASILTPGKPMVIASIDDINSTKRMQIELTATKIE
jgi:hypothetical protein